MMATNNIQINCCFCDKDLSSKNIDSDGEKCKVTVVKYKCPACERVYCSADCCSGHKHKFDCSGVRLKTPYVHMSKFDQKQFLDDYFFLEDINSKIDRASRNLSVVTAKRSSKRKRLGRKLK